MLNQFLCQPAAISPFSRNTLRDSRKPLGNIGFYSSGRSRLY